MILRILTVEIAPGRGAEFHAFIREKGLPRIQRHPGLVSAHIGRRTAGGDEHAVVVTVWRDWESLQDALGPDPSQPYLVTPDYEMVASTQVEHFEAVELPPLGGPAAPIDEAGHRPSVVVTF